MARDHFVSRFYLEGFADRTATKAMLSVYLTQQRVWKRLSPQNIGVETGYYTISEGGGRKNTAIEKVLAEIESRAATIIRERVANKGSLNDEERVHFALFVATMLERVPATIDNLGSAYARTIDLVRRWGTPVPEDADNPETGSLARTTLRIAFDTTAPIIHGMSWRFVFSEKDLATSDRPVCLVDPTNTGRMPSGLLSKGMQVWFPVSRGILFMATHFDASPLDYVSRVDGTAKIANTLTVAGAKRFVAASSRNFDGSVGLGG